MEFLGIDPHLDPKPYSLKLYSLAIARPFNPPDKGRKLPRDLIDCRLETVASLVKGLAVLERQIDQRHFVSIHTTACPRISRYGMSCAIVGESSLSDSRIMRLICSSACCTIRESVRSPKT